MEQAAGMVTPDKEIIRVKLPLKMPKRPLLITSKIRWKNPQEAVRAGAAWGNEKGLVYSKAYNRRMYLREIPEMEIAKTYFFGRYIVDEKNGSVGALREYREPYPLDTVCVFYRNRIVLMIEAKTIDEDEIPKAFRDPEALKKKENLKLFFTDLNPPEKK